MVIESGSLIFILEDQPNMSTTERLRFSELATWLGADVPGPKFQPFSVPFLGHDGKRGLWPLIEAVCPAMSLWQAEVKRKRKKWDSNRKMFLQDRQPSWDWRKLVDVH